MAQRHWMRGWTRIAITAGFLLAFMPSALTHAQGTAVFSRIDVAGNQRIEAETVRVFAGIEPGVAVTPEELNLAIDSIVRGDSYLSPKVANGFMARAVRGEVASGDEAWALAVLTPREREVFQLLALGKANKEVATVLDLSLGTVKKHRENLQRKLDCHSAAELARLAIREGLLDV